MISNDQTASGGNGAPREAFTGNSQTGQQNTVETSQSQTGVKSGDTPPAYSIASDSHSNVQGQETSANSVPFDRSSRPSVASTQNQSFFSEQTQPPVNAERKKKKTGMTDVLTRYTKLTCMMVCLILFASIFVNVFQMFAGDCSDLRAEISRYSELNEELQDSVEELRQQNIEIRKKVEDYQNANAQLTSTISNLETTNAQMAETIDSIEFLNVALDEIFKNTSLTFEEFESEIVSHTEKLNANISNLTGLVADYSKQQSNLTESIASLRSTYATAMETYSEIIDGYTDTFDFSRSGTLEAAAALLALVDKTGGLNSTEYDLWLLRASDVFFNDESKVLYTGVQLKAEFPFEADADDVMVIESMYNVIDEMLFKSKDEMPSLYVKNEIA